MDDFAGDAATGGYQIEYRELTDYSALSAQSAPRVELQGHSQSKIILEDLAIGKNYEILVSPFNSQGTGPASSPVPVYVGEAVPTGAPRALTATALSPTEVRLNWQPPEADRQNGDLLGYKIFYQKLASSLQDQEKTFEEEIEVVGAGFNSHSLIFLDMYTNYSVSILGFNPAGEGPRSKPVKVRTMQGVPGQPTGLTFSEITMNTLKVGWDEPERPNGEILGYVVAYETAEQDESE